MKVVTQSHGSVSVLIPHGPLAGEEIKDFKNAFSEAIALKSGRVVLDMCDTPFLDSEGIETLLDMCGSSSAVSARPRLAQLCDTTREALDLTNVLDKLIVFDTVENAIRSFKR